MAGLRGASLGACGVLDPPLGAEGWEKRAWPVGPQPPPVPQMFGCHVASGPTSSCQKSVAAPASNPLGTVRARCGGEGEGRLLRAAHPAASRAACSVLSPQCPPAAGHRDETDSESLTGPAADPETGPEPHCPPGEASRLSRSGSRQLQHLQGAAALGEHPAFRD